MKCEITIFKSSDAVPVLRQLAEHAGSWIRNPERRAGELLHVSIPRVQESPYGNPLSDSDLSHLYGTRIAAEIRFK